MKLTKAAIDAILEHTPAIKQELAMTLTCSEGTINRHLRENQDNGDLTKVAALQVIRQRTGLSDEQILEEDTVKESVSSNESQS